MSYFVLRRFLPLRPSHLAAAFVTAAVTLGFSAPAGAGLITYNLDNVSATFNVAPGVGGFPGGFQGLLTFTGSFVFDSATDKVVSVSGYDIFQNGSSLNAYGFNSPGYGPNVANGFSANSWTVLTNALYVTLTFADDLALGATDLVTAASIYDGYTIPVTTVVTGSADPVATPEPASLALLLAGVAGLAGVRRRKARHASPLRG